MPPSAGNIDTSGILVSCLMVTLALPERFSFVKRSIAAYCRQTVSAKELVVLVNGGTETGRRAVIDHIGSLGRPDIRIVEPSGPLTLGGLRNMSVAHAAGDVLCQWDDDDLCHPQRLERQLSALLAGDHEAAYLQEVAQYFPESRTLHWTNWRATDAGAHPGTLMVRRSVPILYPAEGAGAALGEDLAIALFLKARGKVCYIAAMPHLFVYVSHGKNSWPADHHRMLAAELSLSQGLLRRREAAFRAGLAPFDFGPGAVSVAGSNGVAFTIRSM